MADEKFQNFITKINDFNGEFSNDFKKEIVDVLNLLKNQNARLKGIIAAKDAVIRQKELLLLSWIKIELNTEKDLEKAENELKTFKAAAIASKKARFYFTFKNQNWSLPTLMVYYMSKNPATSKGYKKMIKSCKYFFIKNPILLVPELFYCDDGEWYVKEETYDYTRKTEGVNLKSISSKVWITECSPFVDNEFDVNYVLYTEISCIIPKIYRCDAKEVKLSYEFISYNEFLFLSSNAERLMLTGTVIKNEDGILIPFENIIESVPKVKKIEFSDYKPEPSFSTKTLQNLFKIPHFSKIKDFIFYDLTESFDIDTIFNYIKTKNEITKFELWFYDSISDAFITRLKEIIYEIKEAKNLNYIPPKIEWI